MQYKWRTRLDWRTVPRVVKRWWPGLLLVGRVVHLPGNPLLFCRSLPHTTESMRTACAVKPLLLNSRLLPPVQAGSGAEQLTGSSKAASTVISTAPAPTCHTMHPSKYTWPGKNLRERVICLSLSDQESKKARRFAVLELNFIRYSTIRYYSMTEREIPRQKNWFLQFSWSGKHPNQAPEQSSQKNWTSFLCSKYWLSCPNVGPSNTRN